MSQDIEANGGSAAPYYYRAHQAWEAFRESYPGFLSADLHLANAVYYSDMGVNWDENQALYEKTCKLVVRLGEQTERSIDDVVDALEDMVLEDDVDIRLLDSNPLAVHDMALRKL